ncbi:MAG TPA: hypothetical protein DHV26_07320 [Cytophagales bacterium]|nr:hypothetical protein [Cytophagales bacterium]
MKKLIFPVFVLIITAVLAEVTLRVLTKRDKHIDYLFGKKSYFLPPFHVPQQVPVVDTTTWHKYNVYDADLGWSIGKLGAQPPYYSNHAGYRCSQLEYDSLRNKQMPYPELSRAYDLVCLGNSFTHGDEVAYEDTWPYRLQQRTGLRVLNLGVGGYGIDQAWLRYEKEKQQTKLIILGMVAGDLDRARSQIYNLTVGGLKTKPMYVPGNGALQVVNQPTLHGEELLREFSKAEASEFLLRERNGNILFNKGWHTNFYLVRAARAFTVWQQHRQPVYRTAGDDLTLCVNLLAEANHQAEQQQARFVVLLLDNLNTFIDYDKLENPWGLFIQKLEEQGIEYWYYGDQFYKQFKTNPDAVINKGLVHYTPQANDAVAEFVEARLNVIKMED